MNLRKPAYAKDSLVSVTGVGLAMELAVSGVCTQSLPTKRLGSTGGTGLGFCLLRRFI